MPRADKDSLESRTSRSLLPCPGLFLALLVPHLTQELLASLPLGPNPILDPGRQGLRSLRLRMIPHSLCPELSSRNICSYYQRGAPRVPPTHPLTPSQRARVAAYPWERLVCGRKERTKTLSSSLDLGCPITAAGFRNQAVGGEQREGGREEEVSVVSPPAGLAGSNGPHWGRRVICSTDSPNLSSLAASPELRTPRPGSRHKGPLSGGQPRNCLQLSWAPGAASLLPPLPVLGHSSPPLPGILARSPPEVGTLN